MPSLFTPVMWGLDRSAIARDSIARAKSRGGQCTPLSRASKQREVVRVVVVHSERCGEVYNKLNQALTLLPKPNVPKLRREITPLNSVEGLLSVQRDDNFGVIHNIT